jgi:short-subunit dehydrogenase
MELAGKRVLLTGATGGLGEAAAHELARQGAVLLLSGRDRQRLDDLAAQLAGAGHEALAADLAEQGAAESLVERAGRVDVLIANAGLPGGAALIDLEGADVEDVVRVNLEAPIQMARCVIPQMRERGDGHLVFVASLTGKFALPESSLYSSTKFGLRGFAWSLRPELARYGIGVSLITPGFIRDAGMFAKRGRRPPPGAGTRPPSDFAAACVSAIVRNRDEVVVAPPQLRLLAQLALVAPGPVSRLLRRARPDRSRSGASGPS